MIKRLLIANRGEIARRVARTCRRMGVEYVAVHSQADDGAPHLEGAFARVAIGPAAAARSYLDGERLIAAALETGCDAVHPGYGFLSENADFARAVEGHGLIFVGPAPDTIADMGDKSKAKAIMQRASVPTVPGSIEASDCPDTIAALLEETGHPALLKPVAGGGGKGMAIVENGGGRDAIASAIRTARSSFGDGRLLVERFIRRPRHVEVQVFGDGRGEVVHLFERECSLQRRHQKVIEEAPAARFPQALREAMTDAALRGARAMRYRNAGTFEFIVGEDGSFYFLEVNTRLQVEHPVTEAITGLDLVEWQLRIAAGEPLPLAQSDICVTGHSIECRIYAEDPGAGFRPSPGRVTVLRWPENARVESAVEAGTTVPPDYDPMICKLIVHGGDRDLAMEAMRKAIGDTAILGVSTNLGFLDRLLQSPEVVDGRADTGFIDAHLTQLLAAPAGIDTIAVAAAVIAWRTPHLRPREGSPWHAMQGLDRPMLDPVAPLGRLSLLLDGARWTACIQTLDETGVLLDVRGEDGAPLRRFVSIRHEQAIVCGRINTSNWYAQAYPHCFELVIEGIRTIVDRIPASTDDAQEGGAIATAQMPGIVVAIAVNAGDVVARGDLLGVIEAMKFENPVVAQRDGVIIEIGCAVGDQVRTGQVLFRLGDESSRPKDHQESEAIGT